MPSTKDEPTVFYARDKNPPIDGLDGPVPSIEDENESFEIVVSDIAGVDDGEEKAPTPINPKSFARSVKRIRSAVSSEDESSSKTMETPPKRQRRVYPGAPATPRRSERISSAAASSAPKEEEPPAVKVPAKRGRGRPPGKTKAKAKANGSGPRLQQEWEIERIVDSQIDADTLEQFYLVKWKGFGAKENTWEPKKNLGKCRQLIVAFEKTMKKRR